VGRRSLSSTQGGLVLISGCPNPASNPANTTNPKPENYPTFTLAWSEYPSWSVFGVAAEKQLIDGAKGKIGRLEERWGVDIELKLLEYDKCINAYTDKTCDAVCITNMDTLNPAVTRKSVAIMPTSTSVGADALIVNKDLDLDKLVADKIKVRGLAESVSDYAFYRLLEKHGKDKSKYVFDNMDPGEAARQMQAKNKDVQAIMVWNPFVLQTLRSRGDEVKQVFSSEEIPEEIIDMVVVGDDVLTKEKGKEFACCVIQTFYEFNKMLNTDNKEERKKLLVDLGDKFSSLNAEDMEICCTKTRFYSTPDKALGLFKGEQFPKTMDMIVKDYLDRKVLKSSAPKLGYGSADQAPEAQFRFDPTFIEKVKGK
jgi:ABC-type nitrate/sulfonate/bicarbonate transport system substrate-binding protein